MNDCDEVSVDYGVHGQGISVLDLTGQILVRGEHKSCSDSGGSSPHHRGIYLSEGESADKIEESQPPAKRSLIVKSTPVSFPVQWWWL